MLGRARPQTGSVVKRASEAGGPGRYRDPARAAIERRLEPLAVVDRPMTDPDGARSRGAMAAHSDRALERARKRRARLAFGARHARGQGDSIVSARTDRSPLFLLLAAIGQGSSAGTLGTSDRGRNVSPA
jgi:hypothetical protein